MTDHRCFGLPPAALFVSLCWIGSLALPIPVLASESPRNLAAAANGATLTFSSEVGRLRGKDHTARSVIDGKIGDGYWCSAFKSKPPHWLEVKFRKPERFNTVVLYVYDQSSVKSCRVECWDGIAWTPVAEMATTPRSTGKSALDWEFSDAAAGIVRCRFPDVTSQRVRLWFEKDSSVRLYEVEVLNAQADAVRADSAAVRLDRNASLLRIGFGRRETALPPGWLTVDAALSYTPEHGLGWTAEGRRVDCDRRGGAPFARGFVAGWDAPGRLRLDLPPGRYVAALFAADFVLPVRPFHVEVSGAPLGPDLVTVCPGAWETRRFRIEAGKNGVELAFRGAGPWLLNALLVAPESNLNGLLAEAERLEAELALGSPEWMDKRKMVPLPDPAPTPVSAADRARGYVLFANHPVTRVYPTTRPAAEQVAQPLALQATPGEAVAATLGVVPLRPLFNMRLASTDLEGPDGSRITAAALDLRVVRCWPQIDKTPEGRGKVQVIPELLEKQDRQPAVCAAEGTTRQYWITVKVPRLALPGKYRGRLQFSADGVTPATAELELAVLPFSLQTPAAKTFFMYSILGDLSDKQIAPLLRDMREHGMNSLASDLVGTWRPLAGGKSEFDPEPLRRVLRLAKEAGFTRPIPWHPSGLLKGIAAPEGSDQWNAILADLLRRARQVQDEVGGQELLFYPVDEPFGHEDRLTLAEHAMRVARQGKLMRTYCTPAEKDIARLGSLLDVRCYAIGTVASVPAAAASTREAGAAFWWYTNAARELPEVRRYLAGVWFWSTGADGQGYWVYQSRWQRSRAFQDLEGSTHAHDYVAYPDVDEPIPTVQWECIRMGIDDARYLYTLEAAIQEHRGSPAAAAAEKFLADLRQALPPSVKLPDDRLILYNCPWTADDFTRLRRDVVRHIGQVLHK